MVTLKSAYRRLSSKLREWFPPRPWSVKVATMAIITVVVLLIGVPYLQSFFTDLPSLFRPSIALVEQYDTVKLDLSVWRSNEWHGYDEDNPDLNYQNTYFGVVPKNDSSLVSSGGLILGIYNRLLGRQEGYDSGAYWIPRCRDHDNDGYDDTTGELALSYGNNLNAYYNTDLMVHFTLRELIKGGVKRPEVRDVEVTPQTGDNSTLFRFTARYYHEDETKVPKSIKIRINSSEFSMEPHDPLDTNPIDGIRYNYTTTLKYGMYKFQVITSDGTFKVLSDMFTVSVNKNLN